MGRLLLLSLALAVGGSGQRVFESKDSVVYEDAVGKKTSIGLGFSPVLMADGRVALLRGRKLGYGEEFDCDNRDRKNWVSVYDPATKRLRILFDRVVDFAGGRWSFCIFFQMQISSDASMLYLVSPVYATSGSLAMIDLKRGTIRELPGVLSVWVIESGPHRDELIYQARQCCRDARGEVQSPRYPFFHARADGGEIKEISDEFTNRKGDGAPRLREYLRGIEGTITFEGRRLP